MSKQSIVVQRELHLSRGSVLRIVDGRGVEVHVGGGCVWLTQQNDPVDRTLCKGLSFDIGRQGHTVLQALSRSVVTLTAPRAENYARRIDILPRGAAYAVPVYRAGSRTGGRVLEALGALLAILRRAPAPTP